MSFIILQIYFCIQFYKSSFFSFKVFIRVKHLDLPKKNQNFRNTFSLNLLFPRYLCEDGHYGKDLKL